jgi:hypothetical protein
MKTKRSPFARALRTPGYRIQAAADGEAEVLMYDEIGFWGIQAKPFIEELQALDVGRSMSGSTPPAAACSTASRSRTRSASSMRR